MTAEQAANALAYALIALMFSAGVAYGMAGDIKKSAYFILAAALNLTVIL